MSVLIGIALKSLIISGLALGLLKLMSHRSAAERSWVAHIGLLALVVVAFAPLVLPTWSVETPALLAPAPEVEAPAQSAPVPATVSVAKTDVTATATLPAASVAPAAKPSKGFTISAFAATSRFTRFPRSSCC